MLKNVSARRILGFSPYCGHLPTGQDSVDKRPQGKPRGLFTF